MTRNYSTENLFLSKNFNRLFFFNRIVDILPIFFFFSIRVMGNYLLVVVLNTYLML